MALNKTKAEDDHKKQAGLEVKDPATALEFLMEGDFKCEEDDMTFDLLSVISMQLSQQPRAPKYASEAFKAISYIILELHQKRKLQTLLRRQSVLLQKESETNWLKC